MTETTAEAAIAECLKICARNPKDLRLILAQVKGISPLELLVAPEKISLTHEEMAKLSEMWGRRAVGEPLSKIINRRAFWKHDFFVNSRVLDPRPETELIIRMVLAIFAPNEPLKFLDVGTGSGCILLSLLSEFKNAAGVGIDLSEAALEVADNNRRKLALENATFVNTNWNDYRPREKFDVVVANPPYVKTADIEKLDVAVRNYDPWAALDGGESGLRAYEEICALAGGWLSTGGSLFLEVGRGQSTAVVKILRSNGFTIREIANDLNNIKRTIHAAAPT
ncbi:MAG: peptide chain release factor N(5)-glutamine methyltransferase [Holosporaceae bacterium]|jgi:release factor glutamine methyltransferase|nr:peptide chain release factor N(5)-glutamine methyltransferase [Holosporaceae bacterium]